LPTGYYVELTQILKQAGWHKTEGGKGSHEKWRHAVSDRTIIVPPFQEPSHG